MSSQAPKPPEDIMLAVVPPEVAAAVERVVKASGSWWYS